MASLINNKKYIILEKATIMANEKIALLTYKEEPVLADSEQLLPQAFRDSGLEAIAAPWDDNLDWSQFSTIILRACWNYHLKRDEFLQWLDDRSADGIKIWNPLETIRWNTDKHYLLDLERKGVKIIPSVLWEPTHGINLAEIINERNWKEAIVKPTVGASAFQVNKFNVNSAFDVEEQLDRDQHWLVQQFRPEVNTEGEYSLIFFDREYSHAVMKRPKDGDFRTQPHYGGTEWEIDPEHKVIEQATELLHKIDGELLYARVDGLLLNGDFHLMELELAEPYLFFGSHPKAPQRFVNAYKTIIER